MRLKYAHIMDTMVKLSRSRSAPMDDGARRLMKSFVPCEKTVVKVESVFEVVVPAVRHDVDVGERAIPDFVDEFIGGLGVTAFAIAIETNEVERGIGAAGNRERPNILSAGRVPVDVVAMTGVIKEAAALKQRERDQEEVALHGGSVAGGDEQGK